MVVCLAIALVGAVIVIAVLLTRSDDTPPNTTQTPPGLGVTTQETQTSQSIQVPLADVYTGTSMNHTAAQFGLDGSAKLKLTFTNKDPEALAGEIEVDGRDVGGTGLFEGTADGDRISLDVSPKDGTPPSPSKQMHIFFS